ncbi:MAG: hypothetical protein HY432_01970 [Candidatus Liptonbacteria bacterium]|nr:hypothetical protein [Candidatus Liptonbacteria bacterium]
MHDSHGDLGHEHVGESGYTTVEIQSWFGKDGAGWQIDPHNPLIEALQKLDLGEPFPTLFLYKSNDKESESLASKRAHIVSLFLEDPEVQRHIEEKDTKSLSGKISKLKSDLENADRES